MNKRNELIKFLKFNAIGIVNTLIDILVYSLLSKMGMGIVLAQVISYSVGMLNSYIFNALWTFKDTKVSAGKTGKFVLVNLLAMGVSIGILSFCKATWGLIGWRAKIISTPFSLAINFLGNRLFVFVDGE